MVEEREDKIKTEEKEKDDDAIIEAPIEIEEESLIKEIKTSTIEDWKPKTSLGRKVKNKEITNIDEILEKGLRIMESEIVDSLLQTSSEILLIGQAKGKFGGGKRRAFMQTQKKTREGNKPQFQTAIVVGDMNGHIGLGFGKAKDTLPAKEKAIRNAKLNIFRIKRGCGSWHCGCGTEHSIPFTVEGRSGSVRIKLMPAPKGKGLIIEKECAKILKLAGISDIWSKSSGQSRTKTNMIKACINALKKLESVKIRGGEEK